MSDIGSPRDNDVFVRGCRFPRHLLYDVPNHMWYLEIDGGLVRVGMTSVAAALADNRIFAFTPKRVGRELEVGRSCATIESSKWVGPARIAFDGIVEAVNEALIDDPGRLVTDPYGAGWMLIGRPAGGSSHGPPLLGLVTGDALHAAYTAWMNANEFRGCDGSAS